MIDFEDLALEILENFADSYSEMDKERLIGLLKSIRSQTTKEICDFAEGEIKRLGKETTTDSFGERPLLFYEAAGILVHGIEKKFGGEND